MKLKQLMCSTAVLAGVGVASLAGHHAFADETEQAQPTTELTNTDKLYRLKAEKNTVESNINALKQKLADRKSDKKVKSVQSLNIGSKIAEAKSDNTTESTTEIKDKLKAYKAREALVDSKIQLINKQEQKKADEAAKVQAEQEAQEKAAKEAQEKAAKEAEEAKKAEDAKHAEEQKEADKKAATQQAISSGTTVTGSVTPVASGTANSYPTGQCTWGVKCLAPWVGDYWGNAGQWIQSAQAAGFRTGTKPVPGAVAVWPSDGGGYGHVAYVTDVQSETNIQVSESNYAGNMYIGNFRGWFNPQATWSGSAVYYIYPN